ncbi:exo-alpha-sialidase [Arthrobacter sp. Sr24]
MKSTDTLPRTKRRYLTVTSGVLAAGLLTTLMGPAYAQDATPAAGAAAPAFADQALAVQGDNALDASLAPSYRIPALVDLGGGVILASYDGRPNGGDSPAPNSIIQRRSVDGGKTWGAPTFIARGQIGAGGKAQFGFSDPSYIYDAESDVVFNFHVYSKDQGFWGSILGTDDSVRNVTGTEVSVSTDRGLTWSTDPANIPTLPVPQNYAPGSKYAAFDGPLVTDVVKPVGATVNGVNNVGGVVGMFASSGEGIQLKYGAYKGRLIQQFAGRVLNTAGKEVIQAYSVYSDDHGKTWVKGGDVGTGMDENKSVELSNGDVMLNSRDNANGKGRKVAISKDGGQTWGPVSYDTNLVDPTNNASITRMYPEAVKDSADAKILLFSNANSAAGRTNGTVRYSCDDGKTWSAGKQFKAGAMAYSTMTALSDGNFGILYEGNSNNIHFAKFNAAWLGVNCDLSVTAQPLTGANGATVEAMITVNNNGDDSLTGATASLTAMVGWKFGTVAIPAVAPGESATVAVPVTIPDYLKAGTVNLFATVSANGTQAQAIVPTTITGGATENIVGLEITGSATDTARDLAANPYTVGSTVPYQFRVDSLSNVNAAAVPQSGNFKPFIPTDGPGNCRYLVLPVSSGYTCASPKHTVSAEELEQGYFVPLTTWQVTGAGAGTKDYTITGDEVDLIKRNPELASTSSAVWNDVDGDGLASAGDTVTTAVSVTNSGNVPLTGVAGLGTTHGDLAIGESVSFTETRELTTPEIAVGAVAERSVVIAGANGAKDASADVAVDAVELPVLPAEPGFEPELERMKLKGQPPVDLGLEAGKISVGATVTLHNLAANEWAYLHLNQHGARIGWFLADANGAVTFTVPEGTKNGKDALVVSDQDGQFRSFGTFHVTPAK